MQTTPTEQRHGDVARGGARHAVDDLLEARRRLAHAEKAAALGELVAGLAHETRTPLTSIRNGAELLRRRIVAEDAVASEAYAMIDEGIQRVDALVEELRAFAAGGSGERERCDLADVVREAVALFTTARRGLPAMAVDLQPGPEIEVDRAQVQVLVLSLLRNAADAAPAGPVRVATGATAGGARLVVADAGPGVPEAMRERVFDPLFSRKDGGTGLGLAIVKRVAEAHAAEVVLEESARGGASFAVTFPRAPAI